MPEPFDPRTTALFLDLDGTLIEFGDTPLAVNVSPTLLDLLERLAAACAGALAVVTGRNLATLDRLLAPLVLPVAGLHGLERRDAHGRVYPPPSGLRALLEPPGARLHGFAAREPGLLVEDKGAALALHYRAAPSAAARVLEFAAILAAELPPELVVQRGHEVIEVRAAGADKGTAITAFMAEAPFAGRRAVFIGDDRTDEHGFEVINARGGTSIKVGAGDTLAKARLADPAAVRAWLARALGATTETLS
ncbi:MAG: trehalose-phosphatase [Gammaproteobacteria bacterium]